MKQTGIQHIIELLAESGQVKDTPDQEAHGQSALPGFAFGESDGCRSGIDSG
jgi:hypothetical protein